MQRKTTISQSELKNLVSYDEKTGFLTYKKRPELNINKRYKSSTFNTVFANRIAGSVANTGYIEISLQKSRWLAHRLVWLYVYGYMPKNHIDHINGIRTDNRICNLREATTTQNQHNLKRASKNNKSTGLLGSFKDDTKIAKPYYSRIVVNGEKIWLGYFKTAIEAHNAHIEAKRKYHEFNTL